MARRGQVRTAKSGTSNDVVANLQRLVDRTQGSLGTARDIILKRTLWPFYFAFHSEQKCANWLDQMCKGAAPKLKSELGLLASGFGASHPLKACPLCMESDQKTFGVAYWHADHQIPGVLMCGLHANSLYAATDKVSGKDRFGWLLPTNARLVRLLNTDKKYDAVVALTDGSVGLWNLPVSFCFDLHRLEQLYRRKLAELGFFRAGHFKLDTSKFNRELSAVLLTSGMSDVWSWLVFQDQEPSVSQRFQRMCRPGKSRETRHPLNHLVMILLLFGTWDEFWNAYHGDQGKMSVAWASAGMDSAVNPPESAVRSSRNSVLLSVRSGIAVSRAAELNGVAVGTAMAWTAEAGMKNPRRPKILKSELREKLIGLLKDGQDKKAVALAVNVSLSTVTRFLLTEIGLHDCWTTRRFQRCQTQSRKSWLKVLRSFPSASSTIWRSLEPAAYAWLYRNDRAWLQNSVRTRPQPAQVKVLRRDWAGRDTVFSQAVRDAALDWYQTHGCGKLTLGDLCSRVRGLRAKLSAIHKLPLTQGAIKEVVLVKRRDSGGAQSTIGPGF